MLFVPGGGNSFAAIQSNNAGRPTAPQGTAMTPAVGSKGSWVQVIASLSFDTFGLILCFNNNNTSAQSRNTMVDVGIGGSGSEVVLIGDLITGNAVNYNVNGGGLWYYFPIRLPAGTRIAVRAQSTVVTAFSCFIQALQKPLNPSMLKTGAYVESIGIGTLPRGTAVTPGTTAEGAWTLLGATTRVNWFWQIGAQVVSTDTTHNAAAIHLDLACGDATNKEIILDSVLFNTNTTEGGVNTISSLGSGYRVPIGTNIYVRAQTSAAADNLYISAYGLGG